MDVTSGFQNRSGGNPRPGGHHNNNSNYNNNNNFNRAPPRAPNNNNNNNNNNTAPRTGSNAIPVATKDNATITCYECGVVGHYSNECPKRLAKIANTAPRQEHRFSTGKKFAPNNPNNRGGRLFHMNAEEAQEAPDVVLGPTLATSAALEHHLTLLHHFHHLETLELAHLDQKLPCRGMACHPLALSLSGHLHPAPPCQAHFSHSPEQPGHETPPNLALDTPERDAPRRASYVHTRARARTASAAGTPRASIASLPRVPSALTLCANRLTTSPHTAQTPPLARGTPDDAHSDDRPPRTCKLPSSSLSHPSLVFTVIKRYSTAWTSTTIRAHSLAPSSLQTPSP
ncbi:hypothetical protein QYE76_036041 [Lolium multiflorum]|uniref:CCHC-type domain-containing protein n=1 Tax=Lolium multiflorum TaxID=4521 RepID=A0AAD8R0B7_LOLMU|nr:hypothetical protein QYE76_036041 [Lolium multiflorum]